ncbi:oligosaccharide flippase family protein [Aureimonas mangrovi]|uniref:oligosaccharide flippase family protein n=1 Tax=Aureimonas mangrovi TaxID=2758041 RepID=UPI00163D6599|nr:oligosaccharide flippase family protein [Aureimonas mangrovi]
MTTEVRNETHELKTKTAFAALWSVLRVSSTTLATFVIFVVLARILGPAEFGTFALASLFVEIGRILAYAGMGDAVTRQLTLDEELADTAFWSTLGFSTAVAAIVFFAAPAYGTFVNDPAVAEILRWLAPVLPLSALAVIHNARLARDFGHRKLATQAIAGSVLSGAAAIAAAFAGWGVYALVVQAAVNAVVTVALAWHAYRWRPHLRFSIARFRSVFLFSASMVVTQVLWMMLARVQDIFISRWYGPVEVGRYRIAWRMIELIGQAALQPIGSVSLVTLSRLQEQPERFQVAYNRIVGAAALATFPLLFGFGALSDEMIPLLFGAQWEGSGDIAAVLVLMAVPFVMNFFATPALAAMDRAQSVLAVAAAQLAATLILTWIAVPYGLIAVAATYVARAYLTMPYQQYALKKHAAVMPSATLAAMWPPFAASLMMAVAVYFAKAPIAAQVGEGWPAVLVCVVLGGLVYAGAILVLGWRMLKPFLSLALSMSPLKKRAA